MPAVRLSPNVNSIKFREGLRLSEGVGPAGRFARLNGPAVMSESVFGASPTKGVVKP